MSVSNDQANAEDYAIKNCVYNKGKKQVSLNFDGFKTN